MSTFTTLAEGSSSHEETTTKNSITKRFILLAMGISAAGKSTFASNLADRIEALQKERTNELSGALLRARVVDADDYHTQQNKHKMGNGVPLTDVDRRPWLLELHERVVKGFLAQGYNGIRGPSSKDTGMTTTTAEGTDDSDIEGVEKGVGDLPKSCEEGGGSYMDTETAAKKGVVVEYLIVACSALKAAYRKMLFFGEDAEGGGYPHNTNVSSPFIITYLRLPLQLAMRRAAERVKRVPSHFFSGTEDMVRSQFTTLEEPTETECESALRGTRLFAIHPLGACYDENNAKDEGSRRNNAGGGGDQYPSEGKGGESLDSEWSALCDSLLESILSFVIEQCRGSAIA